MPGMYGRRSSFGRGRPKVQESLGPQVGVLLLQEAQLAEYRFPFRQRLPVGQCGIHLGTVHLELPVSRDNRDKTISTHHRR